VSVSVVGVVPVVGVLVVPVEGFGGMKLEPEEGCLGFGEVNDTGGSFRGLPEELTGVLGVLGGLKLLGVVGVVGGVFVLGVNGVFGARKLVRGRGSGPFVLSLGWRLVRGAKKLVGLRGVSFGTT
jgi:hypothetical protein